MIAAWPEIARVLRPGGQDAWQRGLEALLERSGATEAELLDLEGRVLAAYPAPAPVVHWPTNSVAMPAAARNVPSGRACRPERPPTSMRHADDRARERGQEHRQQHPLPAQEGAEHGAIFQSPWPSPSTPRVRRYDARHRPEARGSPPPPTSADVERRGRPGQQAGQRGRPRCRAA